MGKIKFEPGDGTCPRCGGQVGHVEISKNKKGTLSYYGCPQCNQSLYTIRLIDQCGKLDNEIPCNTEIRAYEPPTPSGYGEVRRIFKKNSDGSWSYQSYTDGTLTSSDTASSLYELLRRWHNPYAAIEVISKWLVYQKTGQRVVSEVEKLFGKSIMQPVL